LNPYAAPQSEVLPHSGDAERIRRRYRRAEAVIRGVGVLYCLFACLLVAVALLAKDSSGGQASPIKNWLYFGGLASVFTLLGLGLIKLNRIAGLLAAVFSVIMIIGSTLQLTIAGILVHGTILAILMGKGGRRVLSSDYKAIIAASPGVSNAISPWIWVVLGTVFLIAASLYLGKLLS
jgi:hypothetical protein